MERLGLVELFFIILCWFSRPGGFGAGGVGENAAADEVLHVVVGYGGTDFNVVELEVRNLDGDILFQSFGTADTPPASRTAVRWWCSMWNFVSLPFRIM